MNPTTTWHADPLAWGHGPYLFEMFREPTCPFSARALGKLDETLARAGEDKITVKIRLQSQPSHRYSGVVVRCIVAASIAGLQGGGQIGHGDVAAQREAFEFTSHCGGPNMDATPRDIIAWNEAYGGLQLAAAFAIPNLDRDVKWHSKYARQNGIHTSPTFMVDGSVQPDMSNGDAVSDWVSRLLSKSVQNRPRDRKSTADQGLRFGERGGVVAYREDLCLGKETSRTGYRDNSP
jgi:hypothetical protein